MTDSSKPTPHILVVRFSAIGDILLTTPLLRALRARYPAAWITALTKEQYLPLLSHNPHVNEVIGIGSGESFRQVAERLRRAGYTHRLDLHGSLRSLALRRLVPGRWTTYSKRRLARALLIATKRDFYCADVPVAERYFEAAAQLDVRPDGASPEFFLSPEAPSDASSWLMRTGAGARSLVAIAPGAAHATKRWPVGHWIELTRRLTSSEASVVVLGGSEDVTIAKAIVAGAGPRVFTAAGQLTLQQTGALLQRASALVCGDTGVMHMATAVGTPVVALFGPTVRQLGFFPYRARRATVVERDLGCRPCTAQGSSRCPLGHHRCMREIVPAAVTATLAEMLA
ncbi:MAG: lipopolysaccharide heptosyltransferase II [Gemmatimonadales bacterium]|nr:lipopolysaccharide heptosyltransferase II [Gemmatimonadales bacterium]MBA3556066.1 lipopolysaccharide heptosyltransferase II [Gemmatimonadales bacterium]